MWTNLQLREIFHLTFLRWLGHKVKANSYALKGGGNLRFFFKSFRYSEDIDLDIRGIAVGTLRDLVMQILLARSFYDNLKLFGITRVIPPDLRKAKQTETTQRFKVHLMTSAGHDLLTRIEFSRRGMEKGVVTEPVSDTILRSYKLPPMLIPHYDIQSAVVQKVVAIASRSVIQARDVFDLYILSSQYEVAMSVGEECQLPGKNKLDKAYDNLFQITFEQFRDTVVPYLEPEEQTGYDAPSSWDQVRLKVANFVDELRKQHE